MAENFELSLFHDKIRPGGTFDAVAARNRIIYVARGNAVIDGQAQSENTAWFGAASVSSQAGPEGAEIWRWEIFPGGIDSGNGALLSAPLTTLKFGSGWLMRCD
ncbi:MAG: hypothetical protein VCD31_03040, partial [Alphaproteobacteria bacterium]